MKIVVIFLILFSGCAGLQLDHVNCRAEIKELATRLDTLTQYCMEMDKEHHGFLSYRPDMTTYLRDIMDLKERIDKIDKRTEQKLIELPADEGEKW